MYGWELTRTPGGRGGEPASEVGLEGVMRGSGPGIAAWMRRVSIRQAWRRGRASRLCGEGSSGVEVDGGKSKVGERVRNSWRSCAWSSGCRESSWNR